MSSKVLLLKEKPRQKFKVNEKKQNKATDIEYDEENSYEKAFVTRNYQPFFLPVLSSTFVNIEELTRLLKNEPQKSKIWGIVVTSQRAVEALSEAWKQLGTGLSKDIREAWKNIPFFTVGNVTAEAVTRNLGYKPLGAKESGTANALADHIVSFYENQLQKNLQGSNDSNNRISVVNSTSGSTISSLSLLFLVGDKRRDTLPQKLVKSGINLRELLVYQTNGRPNFSQELENFFEYECNSKVDWIVFFSPSGVDVALDPLKNKSFWSHVKIATIGPTTRDYLTEKKGVEVHVVASKPNPENLASAIETYSQQ
ncbi:hypothetical protein G9A89_013795 [Geosiphon pyriformis]|nr:hypothetical protein G9A89_013795 [Geosiphon pyriformis]